jgi:hypothetical protein
VIWLDWEGTKIIIRTLRGGPPVTTTPDQPGQDQPDDAAQRAQEAAAPTQEDETGTAINPGVNGDEGEPQPA